MGVSNVADVAAYTPNLEIRSSSSTSATFFIRGVGLNDFTANAASAVAVYVDDAPRNLPAIQLGLLYDLNGIEIEGAAGLGARSQRLRRCGPDRHEEADGRVRLVSQHRVRQLQPGRHRGRARGPDRRRRAGHSIRTAFRMKTRDGIVFNRCGGFSLDEIQPGRSMCGETPNSDPTEPSVIRANLDKDLNNTDAWATRTSLRFLPPVDDMEWNLVGHIDRVDQLATVGQHLGVNPNLGGQDQDGYQAPEVGRELERIKTDSLNIPPVSSCNGLPPVQRRACIDAIRAQESVASGLLARTSPTVPSTCSPSKATTTRRATSVRPHTARR